jgi:Na+/phosphate symporter
MDSNKKFFDVGVKYILPMTVIGATLAMKKASGLGRLGVFAFATPIMFFSLLALEKARKGELFDEATKL